MAHKSSRNTFRRSREVFIDGVSACFFLSFLLLFYFT